jgi:hypothetical protein
MGGTCDMCVWDSRGAYRVMMVKSEKKRPPGRFKLLLEDNIKLCIKEIGCQDVDWFGLAQDRY